MCICWLIVEVILRNARCNDEIQGYMEVLFFSKSSCDIQCKKKILVTNRDIYFAAFLIIK